MKLFIYSLVLIVATALVTLYVSSPPMLIGYKQCKINSYVYHLELNCDTGMSFQISPNPLFDYEQENRKYGVGTWEHGPKPFWRKTLGD